MIIQVWYYCNKCNSNYIKTGNKDSEMFADLRCANYPRCDGMLEIKH